MSLSLVLPSYKEAQTLEVLLPKINKALSATQSQYEIIVVDTAEPMDNTREVCEKNAVRYINRTGGNFYGDAIRTGIRFASFERIAVMDADGSHEPDDLVRLYRMSDDNDIVIGSRYVNGGETENGFVLKLMSGLLNSFFRMIFRLKVKDASNSFRVHNAEKLKSITLECDNFDIVEEMLIRMRAKYNNLTITEVPIHFNKRIYGQSKRKLISFISSYIKTICMLKKFERQEKLR